MHAVGQIIAKYTSIITGRETEVLKQPNLILFEAADIMAGLLAGNMSLVPSHMYFQYENTNGTPAGPGALARGDGRADFNSISGVSPAEDWLRVPIITNARLSRVPDNSADYVNNAITFNASSASSETLVGESPAHNYFAASGVNGPSKITSVALVAAPVPSNNKLDKLFSRVNLSAALPMQPGHHITIYWTIKFN